MATIKIGGRDLDVRECTIGLARKKVRPFQKAIKDVADNDTATDMVLDVILAFVGHNEGVTKEWLEDSISFRASAQIAVLTDVLAASGLERSEPVPGEAPAQ